MDPNADLTTAELLWNPSMHSYWAAVAFLFGTFWGSFFNVCIYRIPAGLSVSKPKRSFCYRCGSMIHWFDNIPVVSYLVLGGKCRACGARISPRYMIIELLTGLIFLAVFLAINPTTAEPFHLSTVWYLAFVSLLIVGTFTDIDTWIIPDGVTIGGAIAALVAAIVYGVFDRMNVLTIFGPFPMLRINWNSDTFDFVEGLLSGPARFGVGADQIHWWETPANAIIGAAFGAGMLWGIGVLGKMLFRKDAMGMGDVKLFALIGATLGITGSLFTIFFASVLGAAAGMSAIVLGKLRAPQETVLHRASDILENEDNEARDPIADRFSEIHRHMPVAARVHHLPFGPWIAAGAVLVLIFHRHIQEWLS